MRLQMHSKPPVQTELVLVEPGAPKGPTQAAAFTEQNHVLLLNVNESLDEFGDRVRSRAEGIRRAAQCLNRVTYLVGSLAGRDWAIRKQLMLEVCKGLAAEGSLAIFAASSACGEVLDCLGEMQLRMPSGIRLSAVFTEDPLVGQTAAL